MQYIIALETHDTLFTVQCFEIYKKILDSKLIQINAFLLIWAYQADLQEGSVQHIGNYHENILFERYDYFLLHLIFYNVPVIAI